MMLVSHALGNACVRALLAGLEERNLLGAYVTTLGFHRQDKWLHWLPPRLRTQCERRRYDLPPERLVRRPGREAVRLCGRAVGWHGLITHETGWASVDRVLVESDRAAARTLAERPEINGVYGYEDSAEALFVAAKDRGIPRCYELPMGYWRAAQDVFREEAELEPDWAMTLGGLQDSAAKVARKDRELALASHVIVASQFSRQTLRRYPGALTAPISVLPHGAPPAITESALKERLRTRPAGPLRVLFVGGLSQRKGLSYLFAAMDQIGTAAALTVVGRPDGGRECAALQRALKRHTYIESLPSSQIMELMGRHDVLVLPSLFEGFGLVLLEAMAQGLPIIATPHTAAPDLLCDADAGLLVPIRSASAIAEKIEFLAGGIEHRQQMALCARAVAETRSWSGCATALAEICQREMMRESCP